MTGNREETGFPESGGGGEGLIRALDDLLVHVRCVVCSVLITGAGRMDVARVRARLAAAGAEPSL